MPIEDAFEMFIEVLKGEGTEFVENAAPSTPASVLSGALAPLGTDIHDHGSIK